MPKSTPILIGHSFLGILILLSLIPFNLTPSLTAPAAQASGRRRNLQDENGVETLAGKKPHPPAEASPLVRNSLGHQAGLKENFNPIAAQGATFVVKYNPTGDCATIGLQNFVPNGTITAWSQPAKDAFEHALSIWSLVLDANQTIVINACWVDPGNTNILGTGQPVSAFANFTGAPMTDTLYAAALANELAGTDLNDNDGFDHDQDGNLADAEITIAFNSNNGIAWYFGTDSNPPGGQKDFVTAALHEIAHGLGFVSTMNVDTGNNACLTNTSGDGCWGIGIGFQGFPAIYDRFLEDGANNNLIQTYANKSAALGSALTSGNVRFDGPNTNEAILYAPNPFELGSSILHVDQSTYTSTSNRLMTPTAGDPQHHPGSITLGIFKDIGWNIIDLPLATLTKSASATSVEGGQVLTYTLTVTNTGYLMMTDVTITDTVPAGTILNTDSLNSGDVSTSGTTAGSLITWAIGVNLSTLNTLSRTFAVTASLEPGVSTINNTGFVTSTAGVGANDTVSVTVISSNSSNVYLPIILVNGN